MRGAAPSRSRANGESAADAAAVKSASMDREIQRHLRIRVRIRRGLGARKGGVTAQERDVVRGMHGLVVG